jgi:ADP-ribose pyrophosphatase YjhB (NUDIX family)
MRLMEGKDRPVCANCGRVVYYDPKVSTVCVVARERGVLFIKRGNEPGYGLWSLPGGYVDRGEVVEEAAAREVFEETGLEVEVGGLLGVFSETGRPVILVAYEAQERGGTLAPGSEALDLGFFAPDALPPIAFPRDVHLLELWQQGKARSG